MGITHATMAGIDKQKASKVKTHLADMLNSSLNINVQSFTFLSVGRPARVLLVVVVVLVVAGVAVRE